MAVWTELAAFVDGVVYDDTILNQLAANVEYLKNPNDAAQNTGTEQTTTSTSFVTMGANYEHTITTYGGPVLVLLTGAAKVTGAASELGYWDIQLDGALIGHSTQGLANFTRETNAGTVTNTPVYNVAIGYLITGLAAGSHTFKMFWKVDSGGTLRLGVNATRSRYIVREM